MLISKDFKVSQIEHNGFGGKILMLSGNEHKYVLKAENQAQSINEYVAQHILKSLGFTDIPVELLEYDGKCYGVTEYQEEIKAFSPLNLADVSDTQKIEAIELFLLNAILNNVDMGEYYFKDDKIITLDYGESIISPLWVNAAIVGMDKMVWYNNNISEFISNAMAVLSKYYEQKTCHTALESFYDGFALMYCDYMGIIRSMVVGFE